MQDFESNKAIVIDPLGNIYHIYARIFYLFLFIYLLISPYQRNTI